jgi:hypothetical protein
MTSRKDRWALVALIVAAVVAAANVGQILLTHAHYQSWQYIGAPEMTAVHDSWESVVDYVIMPLAIASALCTLGLFLLKHSRVPWWTVGVAAGLEAAVFITSFTMWARWQNELGNGGYVRLTDGTLSIPYEWIMDTHWLRIALMTAFALAVLAMLIRATTSRANA